MVSLLLVLAVMDVPLGRTVTDPLAAETSKDALVEIALVKFASPL
jgi:hypothetical protein